MDAAYKKFRKVVYIWDRNLLRAAGHDIFDPDFKVHLGTHAIRLLVISFVAFILYTLIYYDNFTRLNCLFFLALVVQLVVKLYNVRYSLDFYRLITTIDQLFKLNLKTRSIVRQNLFQRFANYNFFLVLLGIVIYSLATLPYLIFPVAAYYIEGKLALIIPIYIPGINERTISGYLILSSIHIFIIFAAAFGLAAVDIFYAILLTNAPIMARLIEVECNDLNNMLRRKASDSILWKLRFKNILLMHLEATNFISDFDGIFFKICFAQITTTTFSAILMLYIILTNPSYLPAYYLAFGTMFQILIFCFLGSVVEFANDVTEGVIYEIEWNRMTLIEQRMYTILVSGTQNALLMTIGGLNPLNLDTCVNIFKSIYSWTMIASSML